MSTELLLTSAQVGELLHLSRRHVTELAASGKLVGKKIGDGRAWWFHPSDVEAFIRSRDGLSARLEDRDDRPLGPHAQEVFDRLAAIFDLRLPPNPLARHARAIPEASSPDLARYRGHASEETWASYERTRLAVAEYAAQYRRAHAALLPVIKRGLGRRPAAEVSAFVQSIIEIGSASVRGGRVPPVDYIQDPVAQDDIVRVWSWSFRGRAEELKALHEPRLRSPEVRQVGLAAREAERAIAELGRAAAPDRLRRLILEGGCVDCP
ncbi:MAG: helix-turn-helix domain-containing protein [Dehalococcoidia bacterium]